MARILGLDLGTNSIGWAIVDKDGSEFSLADQGVRIFSEGVKTEKGIESSRASERTGYRSARKIKYRRKLRKFETLKVLVQNNMCPLSLEEVVAWKESGFKRYPLNPEFLKWLRTDEENNKNPYVFRDKASKQKIALLDLGRALYHITQRRGFLSNRLDQSAEGVMEENCPQILSLIEDLDSGPEILYELKHYFEIAGILDHTTKNGFAKELDEGQKKLKTLYSSLVGIVKKNDKDIKKCKTELFARLNRKEDLGKVKGEIKDISQAMLDGNFKTLGQYLFSLYNSDKIRNRYTSREEHYLQEFITICKVQGIGSIDENEKLPERKFSGLARDFYRAIFFQRPLKSQKGLIGKCSFEKSKSRCAVSHPDFEEYRMWSYLNTIKIKKQSEENLRFLTLEEKSKLIPKFLRKRDHFNFEDLAKELIEKGTSFGYYKSTRNSQHHYLFNYKPKDTVSGCPVSASLKNILGEDWKTRTISYSTINSKKAEVERTVNFRDLWHLLSVATSDAYLFDYAKEKLGLTDQEAKAFSKIKLKKDFASLSLNAINKILPYVKQGLLYSHAVFMANIENIIDEEIWKDKAQRQIIQISIGKIINTHKYQNDKFEIINGLIKEAKENGFYYSKDAEKSFQKELEHKLVTFCKKIKIENERDKETLFKELYPIYVRQLELSQFIKIKRLDEKIIEFLLGQNQDGIIYCSDEKRISKLYHPSDIEVFKRKFVKDEFGNVKLVLGSPLTSSIKNPMAMRALHQLRKVLNVLIFEGQIDEKTIVHIEMARELNNANKRKAIQDYQKDNKEQRDEAAKEIKKLYFAEKGVEVVPNEDDLLRYQLWIEQNRMEIYEPSINDGVSRQISISQIIGSNPDYDIEHTVPRSISQDNSQMNKTLCSKFFNREVKGKKMPVELGNYEAIIPFIQHWREQADNLSKEIETITRSIKNSATKEDKDKKIRRRHYLTFKRNYLQGKYDRFILEEPKVGFKNSQLPDTGIITRYSQRYLKSYFKKVHSLKGGMVAEFRKQWGIQESYKDDNGHTQYKEKDRSKHTHHTIDAITIACMTKDRYDVLAQAWALEDNQNKKEAKAVIEQAKPWKTFKEDLLKIEDEILVSHYTPDNLKKQSKKIVRVRGKKQFVAEIEKSAIGKSIPKLDSKGKVIYKTDKKGKRIPRFQQGDTVRGSLHQDSIYGAIKDPLNTEKIRYVIRKDLESIKKTDVQHIVDEAVKEKIKEAIANKIILLASNAQQKNKIEGKVWMNEQKQIPINKVRLYANSVKNPLEIKDHAPLSKSRHEHKQKVYGQNDENYCMVIYEGVNQKGKQERAYELINNFDAGEYYKAKNRNNRRNNIISFYPDKHLETGYDVLRKNGHDVVLRKGLNVLLKKNKDEEFDFDDILFLKKRLYTLAGIDNDGIKALFHQEAKRSSDSIKFMNHQIDLEKLYDVKNHLEILGEWENILRRFDDENTKKEQLFKDINDILNTYFNENKVLDKKGKSRVSKLKKSGLTTPKGGDVIDKYMKFPYVKFKVSNFYALIENVDFEISQTGKIKQLDW